MRRSVQGILACLLVLASLTTPPLARSNIALAADATVSTCDWETFSQALDDVQAGGGGTITFACGPDPVTIAFENSDTTITSNVVIDGGELVTLSGASSFQLFEVEEQATLELRNITLTNAVAQDGAVVYNDGGSVTIDNGTVVNNHATSDGGGIFNAGGGVTITNSTFQLNTAEDDSGAIDNAGGTVSITDSVIWDNSVSSDGGAIFTSGDLTITRSTVSGNSASDDSGAINIDGDVEVIITDSTFIGNHADDEAGAIYNDGGRLRIEISGFFGNTADDAGGAIFNRSGGTLEIISSELNLNEAGRDGGVIYSRDATTTVEITSSELLQNEAGRDGGVIFNSHSTITIAGSTLANNTAGDDSGAINNDSGEVTITSSTLSENSATDDGGMIYNDQAVGKLTIEDSTLQDNSTGDDGGAINNRSGTVTITRTTMVENHAGSDGGVVYTTQNGDITIVDSTLVGNRADDDGGAIDNGEGAMRITNSTLSGNTAYDHGGAINNWLSTLDVTNTTLSGNTSDGGFGGLWLVTGSVEFRNSIIAGGGPPNCINDGGTLTSLGYNLSDDDSCALSVATSDLIVDEVQIEPLDSNGGPTQTHYPVVSPDNPIIDAIPLGACATDEQGDILADQRGTSRPYPADGKCDIGSVEVFNLAPSITDVSATPNPVDEAAVTTITVTASDPVDEDDDSLTYAFDCNGDGTFEITGQSSAEAECSYADDELVGGEVTVSVEVSDPAGLTATGTVDVTVLNVAPTVTLGDDVEINEGDSFMASGTFSDPAVDDTHTATVDYGDGSGEQPLSLNTDGTFTLDYSYLADDGQYTVEVCVTDDDGGQGCDDLTVTSLNVPPTITDINVEMTGSQVNLIVTATDPAGDNDPFSYAFDCNNDGTYELDSGLTNSGTCSFGNQEGAFTFGVQVSDDDGGIVTDTVMATVATELCANDYTGVLRYDANCQIHETAITLPNDGPVELCADPHTDLLRLAGSNGCPSQFTSYILPEDGPLHVCINGHTDLLRVVANLDQCTSHETGRVIAATEIEDIPPPRTR